MNVTQLAKALALLVGRERSPRIVEAGDGFALQEWGMGRFFFSWPEPLPFAAPAMLWDRAHGVMWCDKAEDRGRSCSGSVRRFPSAFAFLVWYVARLEPELPHRRLEIALKEAGVAWDSGLPPVVEFDREAALASFERKGAATTTEELAACFGGWIIEA